MSVLTIRLKHVTARKLASLAAKTGRTKTFYVTKALEERLEEFEQTYKPIINIVSRDAVKIKKAIARGERLRFKKPTGMTLKEMINEGRA